MAEVRSVSVHGLPGVGSFTLILRMEFSVFPPEPEAELHNIRVRADWGDGQQRMLARGVADESMPLRLTQSSSDAAISFRLPLSSEQLEAVEDRRRGADFKLSLWLSGSVMQNSKIANIQQQGTFTILQAQWIEALERMEYASTLLLEIPVGVEEVRSSVAVSAKRAHAHLLRGHYDECVAECRKLVESYMGEEPFQSRIREARTKFRAGREQREAMAILERLLLVQDALFHATHLAHHYGSESFTRHQARAIFGAIISVLSALGPEKE